MRSLLALVFVTACSSHSTSSVDAATKMDGSGSVRTCTGAVYDPCTSNSQCNSMNCHLYTMSNFQVCTTTCSSTMPCPNDSTGAPGFCNTMGLCKPAATNSCTP